MSAAGRQKTCAVCGAPFLDDEPVNVEPLIDDIVRYVACHWHHSTYPTTSHNEKVRAMKERIKRSVGPAPGEKI